MTYKPSELITLFRDSSRPILYGQFDKLLTRSFSSYEVTKDDDRKLIISMQFKKRALIPNTYVDIFMLPENTNLGAHFHEHASAKIYILHGTGVALIDDKEISFKKGAELDFPAGVTHDVKALNDEVVFVSVQDKPIILDNGKRDYFPA